MSHTPSQGRRARSREIREHMAAHGVPYNVAARQLAAADRSAGEPPATAAARPGVPVATGAVWLQVHLTPGAEQDQRAAAGLEREDLDAIATELAQWQYVVPRCPAVLVHPAHSHAQTAILLARLLFEDGPGNAVPASGSPPAEITADRLAHLADRVRWALNRRERRCRVHVVPIPAPVPVVTAPVLQYGTAGPEIAGQDWRREALAVVTRETATTSPYADEPARYRPGQVLRLEQDGRAGWPVTTTWKTSSDVDLAHYLPADRLQVVEILHETPTQPGAPYVPTHERLARRWRIACTMIEMAADDPTMTLADWILVCSQRQEVVIDLQSHLSTLAYHNKPLPPPLLELAADVLERLFSPGALPAAAQASPLHEHYDVSQSVTALRALAARPADADTTRENISGITRGHLDTARGVDGSAGGPYNYTLHKETDEARPRLGARLIAAITALDAS
ncbi:hypothetical protein [Nonomuraea sp. NPDC050310]|uniref:hypothetical protein n=1 Tax=Nonomuraea sp. NPDC050310 TaxID=3154935 RepID=UPI0033DE2674